MSDVDPNWFETFFETDEWLLLATSLDQERTEREVGFLAGELPAGGRILDLACGTGRIAVPLAARGFDVAGLDISRRALEAARNAAPGLDLRNGDMRSLPWQDETFDGVINLWTAFGYFEDQAEDERVLAEVVRVLKPGGVFVLDNVNVTALHRSFMPRSWNEIEGVLFLERRVVDIPTGRAQAYWTFVYPDGRRVDHSFDHRLYPASDYASMFRRAGLEPAAWYGGFDGSELTLDSWRLVVVATKTA